MNKTTKSTGVFLMVLLFSMTSISVAMLSSLNGGYDTSGNRNVRWKKDIHCNPCFPTLDTDNDGLGENEEYYKYNTNISNPDTDGDGMDDYWEVYYGYRNRTWAYLNPNNASDALNNPDNDGYDIDGNGLIDATCKDMIFSSKHIIPVPSEYQVRTIAELLANPAYYNHRSIRINDTRVISSVKEITPPSREIEIYFMDNSSLSGLRVVILRGFNRPSEFDPQLVYDLQGQFSYTSTVCELIIGINECLTNLMEYLATQDYDNFRTKYDLTTWNTTDPTNCDTDQDGMSDGFELFFGSGFINTTISPPRWEWIIPLDPTYIGDAGDDLDSDGFTNLQEYQAGKDPTDPNSHP